jgi:predicted nucleic acid-binding protein
MWSIPAAGWNISPIDRIDLTDSLAIGAASLSVELKLPLADSIILHIARNQGATLWTQDAHFEGLQGVRYIRKAG